MAQRWWQSLRSGVAACGGMFLGLTPGASAAAAGDGLKPYAYHEGFETPCQIERWATNGKQEIHFSGTSDEKAFSGTRSYKLDMTIQDGSYHYFGIRLRVPAAGELRFSGRLCLASPASGVRVGLGGNFLLPPSQHSGCAPLATVDTVSPGWELISGDLVDTGRKTADLVMDTQTAGVEGRDVTPEVECWGLFVYATAPQRVTLYLDDIRIEGRVPDLASYAETGRQRFAAARGRITPRLADWRARAAAAGARLPVDAPAEPVGRQFLAEARQSLDELPPLLDAIDQRGYANRSELDAIETRLERASQAGPALAELARCLTEGLPYIPFVPRPISNVRITPETKAIPGRIGRDVTMAACPGEYESASFVLQAVAPLKGLQIEATDLAGPAGRIPKEAVDLRVVKCWYQSGTGVGFGNQRLLVPELLLHDDALVRVDLVEKVNYLRSTDAAGTTAYVPCSTKESGELDAVRPVDAPVLLPLDLEANSARQFWITLAVPEATPAGDYQGTIRLTSATGGRSELRLGVHVYPFRLEPCPLQHSIYYRGRLTTDGKGSISSEQKSEAQYEAEMRDLHAHGVDYPTVYQPYDEVLLPRMLEMRRRVGLPAGPLYVLGLGTGAARSPADLATHRQAIERYLNLARAHGYSDVYFYGTDEASGDALTSQRDAWRNVQDAGGKTFVACYAGTFEAMGSLLNLAVFAGAPKQAEADKYHGVGNRIFCYAFPQVGNEEPETYRRNFGLMLWKNRYDGAMDYAYQHSFHHIWNDFDDTTYRDHVFAYPTVDGVVDTVQWEGYREAVDDVRYLGTLAKAVTAARASDGKRSLASEADTWLAGLDPQGDLDAIRRAAADWIVRLQAP